MVAVRQSADGQYAMTLPAKVAREGQLEMCPIVRDDAIEFIRLHHRHHVPPPAQFLLEHFGIHDDEGRLRGVATVSKPINRSVDDGWTCEVTRLCTDGVPNGCSMLYAACWKWAQTKGYRRILTYILEEESGHSLRAAGWRRLGTSVGGTWEKKSMESAKKRYRVDKHPTGPKARYGMGAWAIDEDTGEIGVKGK